MFTSFDHCLWETSTFAVNKQSSGQGKSICTPQFDDVLQRFEKNPSTSNRVVHHTIIVNCRRL
jgi:hypothetical protein